MENLGKLYRAVGDGIVIKGIQAFTVQDTGDDAKRICRHIDWHSESST